MRRLFAAFATLVLTASALPVRGGEILDQANAAFAKVEDYTATLSVHETDGKTADDHTYAYAYKRPSFVKLDILSGSNSGGGLVWTGGDKVNGHRGGLLKGFHLKLDLHDKQVISLRGDSADTGTFAAMLERFKTLRGDISEAGGPAVDGAPSDVVTLKVADPAADKGVTREVLYLSRTTHLPLRREQFAGETLVKSESVGNVKTNVGLKAGDFPF